MLAGVPGVLVLGTDRLDEADRLEVAGPGRADEVDLVLQVRRAGGALTTETRVWLTDASARRGFATYWLLIRPFSGLIRRRWLAAAVRRAEVVHRA